MIATGVERGFATVDGLKIAYESAGSGSPPVVFIHGGFQDRSCFAAQVEHVAGRHRVVALDLRGHGESDFPASVSMEGFEADVVGVLGAALAEPAVLCGHSMAGAVALEVAARRPDLVCGVVMLDGVIFFADRARLQAVEMLIPALQGEHWLDALRGFVDGRLRPDDPPEVRDRLMALAARTRPEVAQSFFQSLFGAGFEARQQRHAAALANLGCPMMYVHATAPADLQRLQELRPDAMLGQVVGSGHYLMLSAAEQLNSMLDRFLEGVR